MQSEVQEIEIKNGMKRFADLVVQLGSSTKTNDKLDALADYFSHAYSRDKVWVIALFSGRRPKRAVNSTQLANWCVELTGIPQWLFEESYHTVGDLGETIALLISAKKPEWLVASTPPLFTSPTSPQLLTSPPPNSSTQIPLPLPDTD